MVTDNSLDNNGTKEEAQASATGKLESNLIQAAAKEDSIPVPESDFSSPDLNTAQNSSAENPITIPRQKVSNSTTPEAVATRSSSNNETNKSNTSMSPEETTQNSSESNDGMNPVPSPSDTILMGSNTEDDSLTDNANKETVSVPKSSESNPIKTATSAKS